MYVPLNNVHSPRLNILGCIQIIYTKEIPKLRLNWTYRKSTCQPTLLQGQPAQSALSSGSLQARGLPGWTVFPMQQRRLQTYTADSISWYQAPE